MDDKQRLQEEQYEFPYHYIPQLDGDGFSPVRYWPWSHHYFGGFDLVFRTLRSIVFDSLLDVGCGDGRFLAEASKRYPDVDFLGIDSSSRAVDLARALNPRTPFETLDIVRDGLRRRFTVATMIEVLEHIPPEDIDTFLDAVTTAINPRGTLIVTVPHQNKPLQAKHYQHFTVAHLHDLLAPRFEFVDLLPFDRRSLLLGMLHRMLGGQGRHVVVTDRRVLTAFWKFYCSRFLHADESNCLRIAAVCREPKR